MVAGGGAFNLQRDYPTTAAANAYVSTQLSSDLARLDANDLLYQIDASRNYDPFNALESISTPITWVNSADDFLNLPGSPLIDAAAKRLKHGRFYLVSVHKGADFRSMLKDFTTLLPAPRGFGIKRSSNRCLSTQISMISLPQASAVLSDLTHQEMRKRKFCLSGF